MNLRTFDLNLLLVFETVFAERHVTRAAEKLNLTQSSVSNALKRLRLSFGDELFHKTPRGMEPTALARELAPSVTAALDHMRAAMEANRDFSPATATDAFVLGLSDYAELVFGPPLVARLRRAAPGICLTMRHADKHTALELLEEDRIQLAMGVLPEPPPHLTRVMLLQEDFVALLRRDHPLLDAPALDLDGYLAHPHLLISNTASRVGAVDRALEALGRDRHLAVVASHLLVAGPMLSGSDLICTMSRRAAEPIATAFSLATRELPLEVAHTKLSLVFHARYQQKPAHVFVRRLIGDVAKELKRPVPGADSDERAAG